MLGPRNNDLKSISDFNSAWADRIAFLIIVGLAVDISAVFVSNDPLRKGLTIVADSLIAIGVWGELWFAKRAREADDGRVAEAEEAVAKANERAAKLEKEAAEARQRTAEIERLTAWRRISKEQHRQIADALRDKVTPSFDVLIEWERGDPEAYSYAWEISNILRASGVERIRGNPNSWLDWQGFGVHANADKTIDLSAIAKAFAEAGVTLLAHDREAVKRLSWGPPWGDPAVALYIFVAPKMPLHFDKFASDTPADESSATQSANEKRE